MGEQSTMKVLAPQAAIPKISRRAMLVGFAVIGASLALSGCSNQKGFAASALPNGELGRQLNVYSWGDYEDPANISDFQDSSDVRVQLDSFGSNEELIAKLAATRGTSGYDVVVPTGLYIPQMVANGLLQPLDHSRIPNMANLDPTYTNQVWDPGNQHSIPKAWGTTGYVYDTTVIKDELSSWQDFLTAAETTASGKTAVLEDAWEVVAIYLAAHNIDMNSMDATALDAAEEYLVGTLAKSIRAFNSNVVTSGIPQGTFALMQSFNGDARQGMLAASDPERWKFVFPTPTANLWMDNWSLATGAQHPDAAYAFINHMMTPEAALREVEYIGYHTGIKDLKEAALADDMELPDLVFPSQEVLDRLKTAVLNDGQERRVEILNRMQAKAGA
ncbi:spermidine/putrescine ABC transporter substrate-binding protein [Arthrobacter sp. GMC3]|uniref:polyamine ABC transporter substrate-binding protein n=1 Tax=Arthrobacter sp. GMC3 TaxID=2058894 RepID=UPI000CE5389E|nr:spermidine/putrescine ABC transporter substrate-binding protein [Arthrobacter sp. GMC3]